MKYCSFSYHGTDYDCMTTNSSWNNYNGNLSKCYPRKGHHHAPFHNRLRGRRHIQTWWYRLTDAVAINITVQTAVANMLFRIDLMRVRQTCVLWSRITNARFKLLHGLVFAFGDAVLTCDISMIRLSSLRQLLFLYSFFPFLDSDFSYLPIFCSAR